MDAAPPKLPAGQSPPGLARRWKIILFAAALVILAVVFFFNPAKNNFYPACQFHRLTGLNCPGCGMTRSLHALLHGDFSTALRDNALFVSGLFLLAARGAWFLLARPATEFFPMRWLWLFLAAAVVFTVLRNLSAFAFLSPG
jgi:hypothetical protein